MHNTGRADLIMTCNTWKGARVVGDNPSSDGNMLSTRHGRVSYPTCKIHMCLNTHDDEDVNEALADNVLFYTKGKGKTRRGGGPKGGKPREGKTPAPQNANRMRELTRGGRAPRLTASQFWAPPRGEIIWSRGR